MRFLTAEDVLQRTTQSDPTAPVVIEPDTSIQEALEVMFENDFTHLPVEEDGTVTGVITHESVCHLLKAMQEMQPEQRSVRNAVEDPVFVPPDENVYDLFEALVDGDHVLVGSREEVQGIVTKNDVFHLLNDWIEPFLMIGEIELSLRAIFAEKCTNVGERIEETFAERAQYDESFTPPQTLQEFTLRNHYTFVSKNWNELSDYFYEDREYVLWLLEEVRRMRNAVFHFRNETENVNRNVLTIAHRHITTVV